MRISTIKRVPVRETVSPCSFRVMPYVFGSSEINSDSVRVLTAN